MTDDTEGRSGKATPPDESDDVAVDNGHADPRPEAAEEEGTTTAPAAIGNAIQISWLIKRLVSASSILRSIAEPAGQFLSTLGDAIWVARVPCVASGALILLMAFPDQTTEAVRAMIEGGYVFTFFCWAFLAMYAAVAMGIYAIAALSTRPSLPKFAKLTVILFVTAAPCIAPFFPVIASWSAHGGFAGGFGLVVFLGWIILSIPGSAILASMGAFGNRPVEFLNQSTKEENPDPELLWVGASGAILSVAFVFIIALVVVMLGSSGSANLELPAVILIYGWAMLLLAVLAIGVGIGKAIRFPFITACIAFALLWSFLDWNDNHVLPNVRRAVGPTNISDAFRAWAESRKDAVSDKPYPVIIVAAEGGGLRAAYMTALVLEELRRRCPRFQHHLFSVIGISGGSVGAALASASASDDALLQQEQWTVCAANQEGTWQTELSPAVRAAGADLLRPLLRGLLVADLPMRLFPSSGVAAAVNKLGFPGLASGMEDWFGLWSNRSTYLERGIDLAWRESRARQRVPKPDPEQSWSEYLGQLVNNLDFVSLGRPPRSEPSGFELRTRMFYDMWSSANGRDVPALILLSTDVARGRRVAISHISFDRRSDSNDDQIGHDEARLLTLGDFAPGLDLSLPRGGGRQCKFSFDDAGGYGP